MKKQFVIHPFLFAVFHILHLWLHNIDEVPFSDISIVIGSVLSITAILLLLFTVILKDIKKAGVVVSILLIAFFSYGHFYNIINELKIIGFAIGRHRFLVPIWCILIICSGYFVCFRIQKNRYFGHITFFLNTIAVLLVVMPLINISVYVSKNRVPWEHTKGIMNYDARVISTKDVGDTLPDIYYIILDGYASSSTLETIYNYDNREFTNYLERKGFFIASKSRSNYTMTFLSLASSLNMEYVNYLNNEIGADRKDRRLPYQIIKKSKVMSFLKSKGYKCINFSSGWGPTNYNNHADINLCGRRSELSFLLIQSTMLAPLERLFINDAKEKILCTFSKLAEIHKIEGPKFIFAHITCPHPPFIFGRNGEVVTGTQYDLGNNDWAQKEKYLSQLSFISEKTKAVVDELLSKSKGPPIIILQADHGPAATFYPPYECGWDHPTEINFRERLTILNAYYLPSGGNSLLYDTISPVNTFRVILNYYFHTNYKLLDDKSYYSNYEKPYLFSDVTSRINKE